VSSARRASRLSAAPACRCPGDDELVAGIGSAPASEVAADLRETLREVLPDADEAFPAVGRAGHSASTRSGTFVGTYRFVSR
jgi:hypothetical protein